MREPADPLRETGARTVGEAPSVDAYWVNFARNLAVAAAAGVFLALIGALGAGGDSLVSRLLYWVPLMMIGAVVGGGVATLASRIPAARANVWLLGAVITLGVAALGAGFVWGYTALFWGRENAPDLEALPYFLFLVLVISAAMTAIMIAVNIPGAQTHASAGQAVRFLERLPAKLRGAVLYAVEAEDHYLRLHTSKGDDLILMRLSDAVVELEGLEGAQTHRSWWVAREAVETIARDGGKVSLVLKGGARAPVSRPNVRALREAGWF